MGEEDIAETSDEALDEYIQEWLDVMEDTYADIIKDWQEYNMIQPIENAKVEYACNNCGKCCNFKDYWVWVYPPDLAKWIEKVDTDKIVPLLLGILFPVEDMDGSVGYGLPSQKMIVEKFDEIIKQGNPSNIIKKTLKSIIYQLHKVNPSFKDDSECCIFYNSDSPNHCTIYDYRPIQCRCYPLDFPQFTKIVIPPKLQERYGAYDDNMNELPECTSSAYKGGDPKQGVKTTEEDRKIVTIEKCNYLTSMVTQELNEEDISEMLIERYHKAILDMDRESMLVENPMKKRNQENVAVKFVAGKKPNHNPNKREKYVDLKTPQRPKTDPDAYLGKAPSKKRSRR